jgi:hypothetical protein
LNTVGEETFFERNAAMKLIREIRNGLMGNNKKAIRTRPRRSALFADAVMSLTPLETRQMLSVSAAVLAGPRIDGSVYSYAVKNDVFGSNLGTATQTVHDGATFNGTPATEIDVVDPEVLGTSQNFYAFDGSQDWVSLGTISGVVTTTNAAGAIAFPASMVANQTYSSNYTQTLTGAGSPETLTVFDSYTLANNTTSAVNTGVGVFQAYEVDDVQTVDQGFSSTSATYQYFISPTIGLVKYAIIGPGQTVFGPSEISYTLSSATGLGSLLQVPAKLVVTQSPAGAVTNATLNPTVVEVEDSSGNIVTTDISNVTLTLAGGNGTLNGTLTVAADAGVATFSDLSVDTAGNYTLVASDGALAGATTSGFKISNPIPPSSLTVSIVRSTLPGSVVSGGSTTGNITLNIDNTGNSTRTGTVQLKVYATTDGTVDGSAILIASGSKSGKLTSNESGEVTLKPNKVLPSTLNGTYTLVATLVDPSGEISTSPAGPTLVAAAPFVAFSETIVGPAASTLAISDEKTKGAVKLTIKNNGNIISGGKSTVAIYASEDGTVANGTLIHAPVSESLAIKVGATKPVSISLTSLPTLPGGTYFLVAKVTDSRGDVTTVTSGNSYPIAAPVISLVPTAASLVTAKNGTGNLTFTVTNDGNINSTGNGKIQLLTSSTGNAADATSIFSLKASLALAPHKPKVEKLKLTAAEVTDLHGAVLSILQVTDSKGGVETLTLNV